MDKMICMKCGKQGNDGARFCGACGGTLWKAEQSHSQTGQRFAGSVQHEASRSKRILLACLCAPLFGVLIFGAVGCFAALILQDVFGLSFGATMWLWPFTAIIGTIFTAWVIVSDQTTTWRAKMDGRERSERERKLK